MNLYVVIICALLGSGLTLWLVRDVWRDARRERTLRAIAREWRSEQAAQERIEARVFKGYKQL